MLEFVIKVALVSVFIIGLIITTVVFCFWFIYILEGIQRKLISHRNILRNIRQREASSEQEILAYNSKTEYVKYIFLFFMNLVEWLGLGLYCCSYFLSIIGEYVSSMNNRYSNESTFSFHFTIIDVNEKGYNKLLIRCSLLLYNSCLMLSLILVGCLCMYLTARYAQKSWIKSNMIPYLIVIFMIIELAIQILLTFCSTSLIGSWCGNFLLIIVVLFLHKQYRKLNMVINWSIVDLKVSGNIPLLKKQVKMKQTFNKMFIFIWAGIILIITAEILGTIILSLVVLFRENSGSSFVFSLCKQSHKTNPQLHTILAVLSLVSVILGILGVILIMVPYTGYGLSTMSVVLWRLVRGKTGYKTHYQNQLTTPLI